MNFIDLFAGAGGLSEGFIKAGYTPVAHVESDKNACKTLETRLLYHQLSKQRKVNVYYNYIFDRTDRKTLLTHADSSIVESVINKSLGPDNQEIFKKIDSLLGSRKVDVLIGGPPCQAYSRVGRSRDKKGMVDDHRNYLYKEYAKFLKKYRPTVFVFENVLGLLSAKNGEYFKNMKAYFKRVGYHIECQIYNASHFNVIQNRERVIIIGWRKDTDFKYPTFRKSLKRYVVSDLLYDLQEIRPGEEKKITKYIQPINKYLSSTNIRNGVKEVSQHYARFHNQRDLRIYEIAVREFLEHDTRIKYNDLPSELKTHNNEKSFLDRFKVVNPNGLCHTIVAHLSKDGHHFIYPNLNQIRSLSVREAARIQSFPDNYYFEGGQTAAFRQIGNAVPPLMSKRVAVALKRSIK